MSKMNENRDKLNSIEEGDFNVLDYVIVILKRKKLILGMTFGLALVVAIISLIMSPVYRAETTLVPPQQKSSSLAAQLMGEIGGLGGIAAGAFGVTTPNDLYVGLLKSRSVIDPIVDEFNLVEVYEADYREDARKRLRENLNVAVDKKSGIITVSIDEKDPQRAAEIANAFVDELRKLTRKIAVTEASQRRLFFEEQIDDTKESLIRSEESLRGFQEKTGAIKIDEQATAVIEGIARLRAEIAAKEVELSVTKSFATAQSPDIQKIQEELKGMRGQLKKLEMRGGGQDSNPLLPTDTIPAIGTEYVRKLRDFKYNEALYGILLKQYEAARLDESNNAAIIQVIDKAVPPERKVKPQRTLMVLVTIILGFFFSVFCSFFLEYIETMSRERIEILKTLISLKKR